MYLCNFLVNSKSIVHSQYLMISCAHIICHYLKTISNCREEKVESNRYICQTKFKQYHNFFMIRSLHCKTILKKLNTIKLLSVTILIKKKKSNSSFIHLYIWNNKFYQRLHYYFRV